MRPASFFLSLESLLHPNACLGDEIGSPDAEDGSPLQEGWASVSSGGAPPEDFVIGSGDEVRSFSVPIRLPGVPPCCASAPLCQVYLLRLGLRFDGPYSVSFVFPTAFIPGRLGAINGLDRNPVLLNLIAALADSSSFVAALYQS
jgi:hypothetical protein